MFHFVSVTFNETMQEEMQQPHLVSISSDFPVEIPSTSFTVAPDHPASTTVYGPRSQRRFPSNKLSRDIEKANEQIVIGLRPDRHLGLLSSKLNNVLGFPVG